MDYKFPLIASIHDMLPHIEGFDEFIVAERDGYTVINYVVVKENTFNRDVPGFEYRREARGIKFGPSGELIARPYHKFFNVNELPETTLTSIDWSKDHIVLDKLDGSMIHPMLVNDEVRLSTKMGITDIALDAEGFMKRHNLMLWMKSAILRGYTPIFEYVSPKNRIVINYDAEDLILTGIRDRFSGRYINDDMGYPGNTVKKMGKVSDPKEYISSIREDKSREGDVVRFFDMGGMVKIKADAYVRIHKIMELVQNDRHIISAHINNELDDVLGVLPDTEHDRVLNTVRDFWNNFDRKLEEIREMVEDSEKYETRKELAVNFIPTLKDRMLAKFVFGHRDGKVVFDILTDHVKNNLGSNKKYDELVEWFST